VSELKAQLEKYRDKAQSDFDSYEFAIYQLGFKNCTDLLLPLVDALEFYANPNSKSFDGKCFGDTAKEALTELKRKLDEGDGSEK